MDAAIDVDLHDFKLEVSKSQCKRKRRISFKTLQLRTPFSCHFLGLGPLRKHAKCVFLRFLVFSNTALLNNCNACRLIPAYRRARLETKPVSFRFSQAILQGSFRLWHRSNSPGGATQKPADRVGLNSMVETKGAAPRTSRPSPVHWSCEDQGHRPQNRYRAPAQGTAEHFAGISLSSTAVPDGLVSGLGFFLTLSWRVTCRSLGGCVLDVWVFPLVAFGMDVEHYGTNALCHVNYCINPDFPAFKRPWPVRMCISNLASSFGRTLGATASPFLRQTLKQPSRPSCLIRPSTPHQCFPSTEVGNSRIHRSPTTGACHKFSCLHATARRPVPFRQARQPIQQLALRERHHEHGAQLRRRGRRRAESRQTFDGPVMTRAFFLIDWLNVGGKSRRTSRSPHLICLTQVVSVTLAANDLTLPEAVTDVSSPDMTQALFTISGFDVGAVVAIFGGVNRG